MADLLIKPEAGSGNKLILQDQAGNAVLTTADSGATLASNITGGAPEGADLKSTGETGGSKFLREDGDGTSSWQTIDAEPEGTVVKSTGEAGGTKFLREDGDGTSSWQAVTFDTGHLIKTLFYRDNTGTGLTGSYTISSTGGPYSMTDTIAVSVVSGRTYEIYWIGNLAVRSTSGSGYKNSSYGIYEPSSQVGPGSTSVGTHRNGGNLSQYCSSTNSEEMGTHPINHVFVAGSTTTQYFCMAGQIFQNSQELILNNGNWNNQFTTGYYFIVREYEGNCLSTSI
tara:strand:+ start:456 stop:1304 length:849 start_codon:yes stop_codon:yes gene_type:complete